MKLLNKLIYPILIWFVSIILFWKFFFNGLIPLPADTIIGMYHPWRDLYAKEYPNGIPVNNPLITDPVRQQFVWKKLVVFSYKKGEIPTNNPYSFSGYPLLANFQSGAFYPLNIIFFVLPFNFAWGAYIYLQFLLGGLFMYAFLKDMLGHFDEKVTISHNMVSFLGSVIWILSGFWVSWAEWGNILHTALWLPLLLFSINKIVDYFSSANKKKYIWYLIYLISLLFSFFAGHLQTFFYIYAFSAFYFFCSFRGKDNKLRAFFLFFVLNFVFIVLSFPQWYPTLKFILESNRSLDVANVLTRNDWFLPYNHFIQLFIPDYFGNPAKGNYFGVWNYGEFLSYIGIIPVFFAFYGIIQSIKDKKSKFWIVSLIIVLIFISKNPISQIPYLIQIPFFSTAQPSRLIFLINFILIIFFTKGMIIWYKNINFKTKLISCALFLFFLLFLLGLSFLDKAHMNIMLRNSIQPAGIFFLFFLINCFTYILQKHSFLKIFLFSLFFFIFIDLSRIFWRYETFSPEKYIFPETKITKFLKQDLKNGFFRIASLNDAIMPPNFSAYYNIPSIDGYDPLYSLSYAKLIGKGDARGFNRIVRLNYPDKNIFDKLKVKYFLTFDNFESKDFEFVFSEGKTKIYKYKFYDL